MENIKSVYALTMVKAYTIGEYHLPSVDERTYMFSSLDEAERARFANFRRIMNETASIERVARRRIPDSRESGPSTPGSKGLLLPGVKAFYSRG